jgi:glycosyltransferase involved in cell wall biosynthesis
MRKKRILLCNEASFLNSGYANYGREILSRLYKTDKYEIAELGCYGTVNDPRSKSIPWMYYANGVDAKDERFKKYKSSPINQFGHWRFDIVCLDFKPDIVFDVRDPWMFDFESSSPLRRFFKWVIMPAMDSIPQKTEWLTSFNTADVLVPYTLWAKEYLKKFDNLWPKTTPAGINTDIFKPKRNRRTDFGIPQDSFVIGSVMRNQRRKLIPGLFEVLSKVREKNSNAILYLHTTFPEMAGWNIPSLLLDFGITNYVYFTYKCKSCSHFFPSKFVGPQTFCPKCNNFQCTLSSTSDGISDEDLSDIYNMFDLYIQYAVCEGFGMPQIEASACGVPVMSVDYSAMSEIVRNIGGYAINLSSLSYEIENHAKRAYPDIGHTVGLINDYISSDVVYKNNKKVEVCKKTQELYNWDNISKIWEEIFDDIDISSNCNWQEEKQYSLSEKIYINNKLSNFDLIKDICENIILDKKLMFTNFIQTTLVEMDYGISRDSNNKIVPFDKNQALEKLEKYANMKAFIDKLRCSKEKLVEDYILYAYNK